MARQCVLVLLFVLFMASSAVAQTTFPALLADEPEAAHAEKLATFGQFVGSWTFEGTEFHDDGTRATDKGELHFRWILGGEAIQDVWRETERSDGAPQVLGTTVRFYDAEKDVWNCTWIHPRTASVRTVIGRKSGDGILLEGHSSKGAKIRWIFSEITPDSFRWHSEWLIGSTWKTTEDLHARRMKTLSASSAAFEELASLVGEWRGVHNGKEATVRYTQTAGGSALMEEFRPAGQEPMVTLFSVDGDRLVATHYCSAGNQPQMATQPITDPRARRIAFSLVRITGMNASDDWHNTGLELDRVDPDHLRQHWRWQSGANTGTTDFEFVRVKE